MYMKAIVTIMFDLSIIVICEADSCKLDNNRDFVNS